jgi:hypothetical protein
MPEARQEGRTCWRSWREEGRTCWRSWNPLLLFLILNRMLLSWQACRKRGRKGGHVRGAGIHGVSISPSEDGGSFEGCRHVLESGQVKLFLFLIVYMYRYLIFLHATYVYNYQSLSKICTYIALMHFLNRAAGNCI